MTAPTLQTERLTLRAWTDADIRPFVRINQDPRVIEFLGGPLHRQGAIDFMKTVSSHFGRHGFGLWAVEPRSPVQGVPAGMIGFVGLAVPRFDAQFMPAVEIGWRLAAEAWGHGFATEGARTAASFAFDEAGLEDLVSFTVPDNRRSRGVMERIGMTHDPADDFDHPNLAPDHPHRRHVLYRLSDPVH